MMSKTKKFQQSQLEKISTPGPCDYSPTDLNKKSIQYEQNFRKSGSFSKAMRREIVSYSGTPGPGEYRVPAKFNDL